PSPRPSARAASAEASCNRTCCAATPTPPTHTARTRATAGSATANSATALPRSSARNAERIAHQIGENLLHFARLQNHHQQPRETDGGHDRDHVLGGRG